MWKYFSGILLRNKLVFTISVILFTVFMGYRASKIEMSYEFAKILPDNDSTFIEYQKFKKQFGEDGNVMVIGFEDNNLFELNKFNDLYNLSKSIKKIEGIKDVLSLPTIFKIVKDDSLEKFEFLPLLNKDLASEAEVDTIRNMINNLPFYEGIVFNKQNDANIIAITFTKKGLDSKKRVDIVTEIISQTKIFSEKYKLKTHYSGMPFIRAQFMVKVSNEMRLFLTLAVIITALILWLFFRSYVVVIFSLVVVAIGVVWSVGILQLFGYKITILSGLIPPLIMVIGLPNCIFLINKYHSEFAMHGNKIKALSRTIETIGVTLFLANITTAIGFGVLYFTKSSLLVEFGVVSAISVMATYIITLILIPVILNFLPAPKEKQTKHLRSKYITKLLNASVIITTSYRKQVYIATIIITLISFWGMSKINLIGYVVDDLPQKDPIYEDLLFFEKTFHGVLPFEIYVDSGKENGLFSDNARTLYKIKAMQGIFARYPEFSKPLSIVEAIKYLHQVSKGGRRKYYTLPSVTDLKKLADYGGSLKNKNNKLNSFIDSTRQVTRVSYQIADIGSEKMKTLVNELKPQIDSIFDPKQYKVNLTGHSLVFLKSNDYLLSNLIESLIIEIVLIALVGMFLFRSVRIIILSKLPCLIPLVITAGVMGFLDIRFKPSTILIFSIAFGISSDGTIYFLSKYRQLLKKNKDHALAISDTIRDTGLSMIYTAIILFFGFIIFAASSFGGTVALGILISLTLIISMCTNLILLPTILFSISRKKILDNEVVPILEEEESEL